MADPQYLSTDPQAGEATPRGYLSTDPNAGKPVPARTWADTASDVATGFVKGAAKSVKGIADDLPHFFGGAGLSDYLDMLKGQPQGTSLQNLERNLPYTNTPQRVGGGLETAAELLLPASKAAEAIPSAERAGQTFQAVMGAAKNVPVDINGPGQVALRINQLAERGGSMPMAVRKFLARITDPSKGDLTYEEARDFASNISRLSANEFQRLTPVVAKEVGNLRVTLNEAVAQAAQKAGKLDEYRSAMSEYARAMKLRDAIDAAVEGAKKAALPAAGIGGASYWLTSHVRRLLGGG